MAGNGTSWRVRHDNAAGGVPLHDTLRAACERIIFQGDTRRVKFAVSVASDRAGCGRKICEFSYVAQCEGKHGSGAQAVRSDYNTDHATNQERRRNLGRIGTKAAIWGISALMAGSALLASGCGNHNATPKSATFPTSQGTMATPTATFAPSPAPTATTTPPQSQAPALNPNRQVPTPVTTTQAAVPAVSVSEGAIPSQFVSGQARQVAFDEASAALQKIYNGQIFTAGARGNGLTISSCQADDRIMTFSVVYSNDGGKTSYSAILALLVSPSGAYAANAINQAAVAQLQPINNGEAQQLLGIVNNANTLVSAIGALQQVYAGKLIPSLPTQGASATGLILNSWQSNDNCYVYSVTYVSGNDASGNPLTASAAFAIPQNKNGLDAADRTNQSALAKLFSQKSLLQRSSAQQSDAARSAIQDMVGNASYVTAVSRMLKDVYQGPVLALDPTAKDAKTGASSAPATGMYLKSYSITGNCISCDLVYSINVGSKIGVVWSDAGIMIPVNQNGAGEASNIGAVSKLGSDLHSADNGYQQAAIAQLLQVANAATAFSDNRQAPNVSVPWPLSLIYSGDMLIQDPIYATSAYFGQGQGMLVARKSGLYITNVRYTDGYVYYSLRLANFDASNGMTTKDFDLYIPLSNSYADSADGDNKSVLQQYRIMDVMTANDPLNLKIIDILNKSIGLDSSVRGSSSPMTPPVQVTGQDDQVRALLAEIYSGPVLWQDPRNTPGNGLYVGSQLSNGCFALNIECGVYSDPLTPEDTSNISILFPMNPFNVQNALQANQQTIANMKAQGLTDAASVQAMQLIQDADGVINSTLTPAEVVLKQAFPGGLTWNSSPSGAGTYVTAQNLADNCFVYTFVCIDSTGAKYGSDFRIPLNQAGIADANTMNAKAIANTVGASSSQATSQILQMLRALDAEINQYHTVPAQGASGAAAQKYNITQSLPPVRH